MSRVLVHRVLRARDRQCGFQALLHTSSQVNAAAATAQKAKPEQPKKAETAAKAEGKPADAKPASSPEPTKAAVEETTPARVPSEKVMRLVGELVDLSVVDFADLTEQLKKRLGLDNVSVSVPMMMPPGMMMPGMVAGAPGAAAGAPAGPAAEEKPAEKQVFDIKLEKYEASDKIKVIKEVRAFTSLGLKEAKELVEKLPAIVKKSVTKDEATDILNKLKAVGGQAVME